MTAHGVKKREERPPELVWPPDLRTLQQALSASPSLGTNV